ncbi:MAG: rod shape-determining protein RodA [Rickettsiales bacterium]
MAHYPVQRTHESKFSQLNWLIITLVCFLGLIGIAMLYSAAGGDLSPWAGKQAIRFTAGFVMMIGVALFPQRLLLKLSYLVFFGCLGLLLVVEFFGFIGMGAQRWVNLGFFNLQPSELMKLALVLALARYYHGLLQEDMNRPAMLLFPLFLIGAPVALILLQPNLGTAFIVGTIGAIILFATGLYWRYFIAVGVAALAAIPTGWHFLHDYQKQRVLTFLNPEADPLGAGYNIMQSKIAIGSGGVFGKGFLHGSQSQLDFLPEKHTDFIFTMIAEEFGFAGAAIVIVVYMLLIVLALATAMRSRSHFGALIAVGISALLLLHIAINIGMVMGLLPVVGVPLPLLSYGGTMQLTMMIGFGLLLNSYVHRDSALGKISLSSF